MNAPTNYSGSRDLSQREKGRHRIFRRLWGIPSPWYSKAPFRLSIEFYGWLNRVLVPSPRKFSRQKAGSYLRVTADSMHLRKHYDLMIRWSEGCRCKVTWCRLGGKIGLINWLTNNVLNSARLHRQDRRSAIKGDMKRKQHNVTGITASLQR